MRLKADKDKPLPGSASQRQASTSPISWPLRNPPVRRRANTDEVKLLMLGYRQELAREFTLFNCFGGNFTALSSLTALGGTYGIGLIYGGPVVMTWGWLVVVPFTISMGLSMAELASAYPTSGALYYWSYKLAPHRLRNLACWLTGWVLAMGQAAFSASNLYTFVHLVCAAVKVQLGMELSAVQRFLLLVGCLTVVGLLNCGSARLTAFITTLGTLWHIIAHAAFCVTVPLLAPHRRDAKYVYTSWQPNPEVTGISSPVYTILVGLLMHQWTLTGYDGSAHLAEETFHAEVNVPRAILLSIVGVGVSGYAFVLALLFVRLDQSVLVDPANETGGNNVVLQILIEVTKEAYGTVSGGVALFTIPIIGTFFCSYQSIANNSRMLYAFARDNGVPLAGFAKRVHPGTKAPVYGVLYMLLMTGMLATPMCFNTFVFPTVTSFAMVGCYLAYALPIMCKLATGVRRFLPGPFHLGPRLSYANNIVSLAWAAVVTVLFSLPQWYPVGLRNMNWSAPILGIAVAASLGWYYFPKYGAKHWFIGPRANLGQFNDVLPSDAARLAPQDAAKHAAAAAAAAVVAGSRLSRVREEDFEQKPTGAASAAVAAAAVTIAATGSSGGGAAGPSFNGGSFSGGGGGASLSSPVKRSGGSVIGVCSISRQSGKKALRATPSVTANGILPVLNAAAAMVAAATASSSSREPHVSDGDGSHSSQDNNVVQRSGSLGARIHGPAATAAAAAAAAVTTAALGRPADQRLTPRSGAAATAAARARRYTAFCLPDGSVSCDGGGGSSSHIAQLLLESGLIEETGSQIAALLDGGRPSSAAATAATTTTADGRLTRERGGGGLGLRLPVRRRRASLGSGGWSVWAGWTGGSGGHSGHQSDGTSGGGGGSTARERPTGRGMPGRVLTSTTTVSGGGGSEQQQLLALGGGPRSQRHPYHPLYHSHNYLHNHVVSDFNGNSLHSYDGGARARRRRASVSVVAYAAASGGGGGGATGTASTLRRSYAYGDAGLQGHVVQRARSAGGMVVSAEAAAMATAGGRLPARNAQGALMPAGNSAAGPAVGGAPSSSSLSLELDAGLVSAASAATDDPSTDDAVTPRLARDRVVQQRLVQQPAGARSRSINMSRLGQGSCTTAATAPAGSRTAAATGVPVRRVDDGMEGMAAAAALEEAAELPAAAVAAAAVQAVLGYTRGRHRLGHTAETTAEDG